ncbi:MAG: DUF6261 family protein [Tannerellaceae bacterium]|jgi:hypothetical protein|nr:DUF6261 family protein [Tannerellaceae bacterium]
MKKIKQYSKLLHNVLNAQFVQFFFALITRLTGKAEKIARLVALWLALKQAVAALDDSFKWPAAAPETQLLVQLNEEREGLLTIIFTIVKTLRKTAGDPAVKAAAEHIYNSVKNFASTKGMEYEAKTAMITNFVQDLELPENAAHLAALGIALYIAQLKAKNEAFQAHYETRFDAQYAHKQSGSTGKLREDVINVFDTFVTGLEGMYVTETVPAARDDIQDVIDAINAEIAQFIIILDRHHGIKKKDDGKKDEDTQTSDTQKPDTTPTPAPDTPDQNPTDEPHHLDPGEHPAMGE